MSSNSLVSLLVYFYLMYNEWGMLYNIWPRGKYLLILSSSPNPECHLSKYLLARQNKTTLLCKQFRLAVFSCQGKYPDKNLRFTKPESCPKSPKYVHGQATGQGLMWKNWISKLSKLTTKKYLRNVHGCQSVLMVNLLDLNNDLIYIFWHLTLMFLRSL